MTLLCVSSMIFAQLQTQVATLKHDSDITVFYGQDAFKDAYTAAASGDIITLSSGTFTATDIEKPIILRGAGCMDDEEQNTLATVIPGTFSVNIFDVSNYLTIEGIIFEGEFGFDYLINPTFVRCSFDIIHWRNYNTENAQFINCRINHYNSCNMHNTTFHNCIIWDCRDGYSGDSADNTIIAYNSYISLRQHHSNLTAYNCILNKDEAGTDIMFGNSVAYNCIQIAYGNMIETGYNCWRYSEVVDVFETYIDESDYEWTTEPLILKDEIIEQCLGTDGTQVGIYGGAAPYNARPIYMVPNRSTVDQQSTPEGKLNVHIEVLE